MGRVLPFIFVSVALVATAVAQAQTDQQELTAAPLSEMNDVEIELLDLVDAP